MGTICGMAFAPFLSVLGAAYVVPAAMLHLRGCKAALHLQHCAMPPASVTAPSPLWGRAASPLRRMVVMQQPASAEDLAVIRADADAIFTFLDADGDGSISQEELSSHLSKSGYSDTAIATIFKKLDTNEDGILSREEMYNGCVQYSPLRSAPGLGNYNENFGQEIHDDADALF